MQAGLTVVDASAVRTALPWRELIEALRGGFRDGCELPVRHHHGIRRTGEADGTLLLMPAWTPEQSDGGFLGVKIATVFPGNAERGIGAVQASYLLSDGRTGVPRALIDGFELTLRRTAAASALAASYLASAEAETMVMVGTGNMAPRLIEAHCSVRPIRRVAVWGRSPDKAEQLARELAAAASDGAESSAIEFASVSDLEQAVRSAHVVSCATLAEQPLVTGAWLQPGAHLDLVGGFTPQMREADDEAVLRSSVFVDTREGALSEAGDLLQPIEAGIWSADQIEADLFDLCRGQHAGRSTPEQITLFKSVGTALEDLFAAIAVMQATA